MRTSITVLVVAGLLVATAGAAALVGPALNGDHVDGPAPATDTDEPLSLVTADSDAAYAEYLAAGASSGGAAGVGGAVGFQGRPETTADTAVATESATAADGGAGAGDAPAHSSTNVEVEGIDEADVIETDGTHIYFSGSRAEATAVVDALPADSPAHVASVPEGGKLFLVNETLVVVGHERVSGYDVSDPANPSRTWERALDAQVRTSRLTDGRLFLVLSTAPRACPVEPVEGADVACTDVLHPRDPMPVDTTYTVTTLDPHAGTVGDRVSFVGTHRSVVSMSHDALYVTYTERTDGREAMLEYLLTDGRSELPADLVDRLETVEGYDLSPGAEAAEVRATLDGWLRSLAPEERHDRQRTIAAGYERFLDDRKRSLTTTHVVRVGVDDLDVEATGTVPGEPLDQFAVDQHDGHLRIATTVGGGVAPWSDVETENDLYVLDGETLERTGAVTGMGVNERIYSVRYDGDRAYVVTFRRIDPYHVLDLSDPADPTVEGELKLPGVSTYLHPLGEDRVLGVGQQDGHVKLVVFDSSDPTDPTIAHERVLDARWSEAARDHHAFLLDARKEVFFLPTSDGGQVFDYSLDRVATVDVERPRRAVYIGDHLYVAGEQELVVVDQRTWRSVARLGLPDDGGDDERRHDAVEPVPVRR